MFDGGRAGAGAGATTVGDVTPESRAADAITSDDGAVVRYRCTACGNLTRFDVVTTRKTKAFHHYSVGGDLAIEEVEVLDEHVDEVSCRWCGHGNAVEVLESEPATAAADAPGQA